LGVCWHSPERVQEFYFFEDVSQVRQRVPRQEYPGKRTPARVVRQEYPGKSTPARVPQHAGDDIVKADALKELVGTNAQNRGSRQSCTRQMPTPSRWGGGGEGCIF
jgi:hypothetical protein